MRHRRKITAALVISAVLPEAAAEEATRRSLTRTVPTADRCAKVEPPPGTPTIPGGSIFGISELTDLSDPCTWEFSAEHHVRTGGSTGSYFALNSKYELTYTYVRDVAFSVSAFKAYTGWSNAPDLQDALANAGLVDAPSIFRNMDFDGLSGEVVVRLLARSPGQPIAVTVAAEPRWARVDFNTGYRAEGYGAEFKLLMDAALSKRLFAGINVNFVLGTGRLDLPNAEWEQASFLGLSGALTVQPYSREKGLIQGVFGGIEARYHALFEGLALDRMVGRAFFLGPTFAIGFARDRMLNFAWMPQLAGRALLSEAPGALDLQNFKRHEIRVKFATPLGP